MQRKLSAFTLVELLVVITILAIISVIAYQNFWGAVDKANGSRKINDVATIETGLQQYKVDNNYYPVVDTYSLTNRWGYSWATATASNQIIVTKTGQEINTIVSASGGGRIMGSGALNATQIGAKGTISQAGLWKTYLSKDLYDPEVGDLKVNSTSNKMIDYGIGRYVYSVYKKRVGTGTTWGTDNKQWTSYNIAYTIKKNGSDKYVTKIVGDFDSEACFDDKPNCPNTLIWLSDGSEENNTSDQANYGVPYAVSDFKTQ
jgi:prepilin-type N-terminal cleavage/methylation domain-containing protein